MQYDQLCVVAVESVRALCLIVMFSALKQHPPTHNPVAGSRLPDSQLLSIPAVLQRLQVTRLCRLVASVLQKVLQ